MIKRAKQMDIYQMLMPSVLGILLCIVCLAGSSFAWFVSNQSADLEPIQAATYEVSASFADAESGEPVPVAFEGESYTLGPGSYQLTLTASGTASTGYCVLTLGDERLFTQQFAQGSISFTLNVSQGTDLKIAAWWGTSIKHESPDIQQGSIIGSYSPVCICQSLCSDGQTNTNCPVCVNGAGNCNFVTGDEGSVPEEQPQEPPKNDFVEPESTEPEVTQPMETQPEESKPEATQPQETGEETTEPEPEETQPEQPQE